MIKELLSGINQAVSVTQHISTGETHQQSQKTGRSFESVLQNTNRDGGDEASSTAPPATISGAQVEQRSGELTKRLADLPPNSSKITALFPELIDSRTRLGLLKEAIQSVGRTPGSSNLHGRLGHIEERWYQLETIMKSNKDLSMGELLGLQAQLYQVSQHIEVMSKVVDQVTGGIKTILNTNV